MNIREKIIKEYIMEGMEVLDIGSTGQTGEYSLWNFLKSQNIRLTGIDIAPSKDARIIVGDMESHNFEKKFDLIVAGDVLEHVNNQGLFLRNICKHLKDDGRFIITTPNAKWPTVFLKPNPTHTLWHDKYTLSRILQLSGYGIVNFYYYLGNKPNYNILVRPLIWHQAMLVVCKKYYG